MIDMEQVKSKLVEMLDETPLGEDVQYPVGVDQPSFGRGVNSGWDAGIKRILDFIEGEESLAITSTGGSEGKGDPSNNI